MSRQSNPRATTVSEGERIPKVGTKLRFLYDFLVANKGKPVRVDFEANRSAFGERLVQLRDLYGLDVRSIPSGKKHYVQVLVGAHQGATYVNYLEPGQKVTELDVSAV